MKKINLLILLVAMCFAGCNEDEDGVQLLVIEPKISDLTCKDAKNGAIELIIKQGNPQSYKWSNGATTKNVENLPAGTYSVTVKDENDYLILKENLKVQEPNKLKIDFEINHNNEIGEQNGSISPVITGGTPPYAIEWSNGVITEEIQNLGKGTYTIKVTDSNNCNVIQDVNVFEPVNLTFDVSTNHLCYEPLGTIDMTISGGESPYNIRWSNNSTTEDLSELYGGVYSVTVTDQLGYETTESVEIIQPEELKLFYLETAGPCQIRLGISGGTPPYEPADPIMTYREGDNYLWVEDTNGCRTNFHYFWISSVPGGGICD